MEINTVHYFLNTFRYFTYKTDDNTNIEMTALYNSTLSSKCFPSKPPNAASVFSIDCDNTHTMISSFGVQWTFHDDTSIFSV